MAIRDLLWACPECGREGGLRRVSGGDRCTGCGTLYRRGRGATIEARRPGKPKRVLPAAAWADRLPGIGPARFESGERAAVHSGRVRVRFAVHYRAVYHGTTYLNRIERFGPAREGILDLAHDRLVFHADTGEDGCWPFDTITAVQSSSSTLQIKPCRQPPVSFRFPGGSARFWEELLTAAVRRHYRAAGRGEIIEFQPRIVTG